MPGIPVALALRVGHSYHRLIGFKLAILGTAQPDKTQMVQQTWHDGTFNPDPGSNNYPNQVLSLLFTGFNGTITQVLATERSNVPSSQRAVCLL